MLLKKFTLGISSLLIATICQAAPISFWDDNGFSQIGDDEGVGRYGYVDPGWGGQDFDAEYMFYKIEGNTLNIGIQTGFDLDDGKVRYGGKNYFAGDLALSFDGDSSTYEYGVDFGLFTKGYSGAKIDSGSGTGIDEAGLYSVDTWNNDIYFAESAPFAIDDGTLLAGLLSNESGKIGDSYYRAISFDLAALGITGDFDFDGRWTMSCGNDYIDGETTIVAEVPEPSTLPLFALGAALVAFANRRRKA